MIRHLAAGLASLFLCFGAGAEEITCPGGRATVWTDDAALAGHVCTVAERSFEQLTACGMTQTGPVTISVLEHLEAAQDECVGRYLCHAGRVELLSPGAMQRAIGPESAYHGLRLMDVFDSFLTHELSHALIHQTLDGTGGTVAQNEYIAYAMQLESMPEDLREILVAPHRNDAEVVLEELNDFILGFAPDRFAARAWLHFREQGNGCGFVEGILKGTVFFGQSYP